MSTHLGVIAILLASFCSAYPPTGPETQILQPPSALITPIGNLSNPQSIPPANLTLQEDPWPIPSQWPFEEARGPYTIQYSRLGMEIDRDQSRVGCTALNHFATEHLTVTGGWPLRTQFEWPPEHPWVRMQAEFYQDYGDPVVVLRQVHAFLTDNHVFARRFARPMTIDTFHRTQGRSNRLATYRISYINRPRAIGLRIPPLPFTRQIPHTNTDLTFRKFPAGTGGTYQFRRYGRYEMIAFLIHSIRVAERNPQEQLIQPFHEETDATGINFHFVFGGMPNRDWIHALQAFLDVVERFGVFEVQILIRINNHAAGLLDITTD